MEQSSATPSTLALGPYDVLDELARTPLGPVYLGCRPDDGGPGPLLALKVLSATTPAVLPLLLRSESHIAARARIRDVRVVAAHAVEHTPSGSPMLVMEYSAGVSLAQLLADRSMEPEQRLRVCLSVLVDAVGGLSVLHEATHPGTGKRLNLVHGHLTPHTVGMCENGTGCITDFEQWGKLSEGVSTDGTAEPYTPPQVQAGERVRDAHADVYSVGVMLWRAVTGQFPPAGTIDDELDVTYPFLSTLEKTTPYLRGLLEVARRAMLPDTAGDSLSADELHTVLRALVERFGLQSPVEVRTRAAAAVARPEHVAVARDPEGSGMVRQSTPPHSAPAPVVHVPSAKKTQIGMVAPMPDGGFDDEVTELWDAHLVEEAEHEISHVTAAPRPPLAPPPPLGRLPQRPPPSTTASQPTPAAFGAAEESLASVIIDDEDLLLEDPAPELDRVEPTSAPSWQSLSSFARHARRTQPEFRSHHGWWLGALGLAIVTTVLVVLVVRTGG